MLAFLYFQAWCEIWWKLASRTNRMLVIDILTNEAHVKITSMALRTGLLICWTFLTVRVIEV